MVTERAEPLLEMPTSLVRQTREGAFQLGYTNEEVGYDLGTRPDLLRDIAFRCRTAFPVPGGAAGHAGLVGAAHHDAGRVPDLR